MGSRRQEKFETCPGWGARNFLRNTKTITQTPNKVVPGQELVNQKEFGLTLRIS